MDTIRVAVSLVVFAVLTAAPVLAAEAPSDSAGLSPAEESAVATIRNERERSIDLLRRLVEVDSGTLTLDGVREVGRILGEELRAIGLETRWEPLSPSTGRAGHLVAETGGDRGPSILLIGHLDTVFEPGDVPGGFRLEGDEARGPGVLDMKGGDVAIVAALRGLAASGVLDDTRVVAYFTGDEESPGLPLSATRAGLEEAAREADVALGFEGGSRDGEGDFAVIARRSASGWTLRVEGNRSHSSTIFSEEVGTGAVLETARILYRFYEELAPEPGLTFNPGLVLGGTEVGYDESTSSGTAFGKTNVVAGSTLVRGGIRALTPEQLAAARRTMAAVVADNLPGTSASIEHDPGYPPMPPTAGNRALLEVYDAASRDLGYGAVRPFDPTKRGAADISFAAPFVEAALGGLGPNGEGSHTPEELLDVPTLFKSAERAAVTILRLVEGDGPNSEEGSPADR